LYKQVAVIVDESPEAEKALRAAVSLAASLNSHLHLVTVVKPPAAYTAYAAAADPGIVQVLEQDHLAFYTGIQARAVTVAETAQLAVTKHLLHEADVEHIVELLRAENADLLVLGLHRKSSIISRLWNRIFELAQDSPCSVLGVH
jgi:nucleotide-binding universal stress UspA family protein